MAAKLVPAWKLVMVLVQQSVIAPVEAFVAKLALANVVKHVQVHVIAPAVNLVEKIVRLVVPVHANPVVTVVPVNVV